MTCSEVAFNVCMIYCYGPAMLQGRRDATGQILCTKVTGRNIRLPSCVIEIF